MGRRAPGYPARIDKWLFSCFAPPKMHTRKALFFICLLILVSCTTTNPSVQRDPFDRTRPSDCVPLPPTPTNDPRPPTSTPNLTTQHAFDTPAGIIVTPFPTPHYIDLSPELQYEDKMVARVYRCNGTWDEYILDPAIFPTAIPLSHGDIIYDSSPPLSLMGQQPPEPTRESTSQP